MTGTCLAPLRVPDASGVSCSAVALLFLLLLSAHASSSAGERDSPGQAESAAKLQLYIHCDGFAGGVRAVTLDRRPQTAEAWREVDFGGRRQRISVMDGYRVMYSYARTYPFANLKAERSDRWRYVDDRGIAMSSLAELAKADDSLDLVASSFRGFSVQTLTKRELAGRALGMVQILSDEDSVIVTIYFMNQISENRRFQTFEEFMSLRDAFIRGYIAASASAAWPMNIVSRRRALPAGARRRVSAAAAAAPGRSG